MRALFVTPLVGPSWSSPAAAKATLWALLPALLLGCPSPTGNPYGDKKATPAPQVGADDPRVATKDGELYTQKTIERAQERSPSESPTNEPGLGSGRPDETNGVCRLFAPKEPHPQCCQGELGFDVETVRKACGYDVYLGESFRHSCGYFFHSEQGPRWLRLSKLPEASPAQAAEHHDRKLTESLGAKYSPSTPVPGVEGAYWSRHEGYRWAFLPGWENARQLSWESSSCSDEGIIEVMKQIVAAQPAPPKAERLGLVPKARMAPT
jgi:hypothetical protein